MIGGLTALLALAGCSSKALPPPPSADSAAPEVVWPAEVLVGEVQPCEAPSALAYEDAAAVMGLPERDGEQATQGAAVDDLDGDGDLDIVLPLTIEAVALLRREGGVFVQETIEEDRIRAAALADVDGDGWRDVLLSGENAFLYQNREGALALVQEMDDEATALWRELAPADLDGDGDLDLFAAVTGETPEVSRDFVVWNEGGALAPEAEALDAGVADRQAFDAVVMDWGGDGVPDVYVVNDFGSVYGPNTLWRGGAPLTDVSEGCACGRTMDGMGGSAGDYDADGVADLYLTAAGAGVLLRGLEDGSFVDVTAAAGADPLEDDAEMGWGSAWLDFDSDGQLDLALAQGGFFEGAESAAEQGEPLRLLRQEGGVFEDVAPSLGIDGAGLWRAIVPSDHNGDGVLDLLVTAEHGAQRLWMSQGCTAAGWLAVEAPVGSRVAIEVDGRTQTAWVTSDPGFAAAKTPEVWFGLGEAQAVDRLVVTLPWGEGSIEVEGPFEARRRLVVAP